jgi:hypothetical protein
LNTDQIVGAIFGFTILELPLIISTWLLIKSALVKITRIRFSNYSESERKKDIGNAKILSMFIIILFILIIFPIAITIAPEILSSLPLTLKLFIALGILIVYAPIYVCFLALFRGLGDVVRAGGSASNVIKQLQEYIYEALEINQSKQNKHSDK